MRKDVEYISIIVLSIASLVSVSLLWKYNLILFLVLLIIAILMFLTRKSKEELKTFILCAVLGSIAEIIGIHSNAWRYNNPSFSINIPLWLFLLWGIASIFIVRVYSFFKN